MRGEDHTAHYLTAARNLGGARTVTLRRVVLPAALPAILGGLKLAGPFAWRSLMAAELLYHTLSLGNLLQTGRDLNDAPLVMAVMVLSSSSASSSIRSCSRRRAPRRTTLGARHVIINLNRRQHMSFDALSHDPRITLRTRSCLCPR